MAPGRPSPPAGWRWWSRLAGPVEAGLPTRFPAVAIGEPGIAFGAPPPVARAHHGLMSH
ncbi:hypothetical protein [Streptomyces sp. NPDC096311]|uniref:hypothetical protein n=1 Tax=Streptomyces sp. NPDC096311 TaxID=3366083 RepID=UPI0038215EF7